VSTDVEGVRIVIVMTAKFLEFLSRGVITVRALDTDSNSNLIRTTLNDV
jgi:hypothetical protein